MKTFCHENLTEIKTMLLQLTDEHYLFPSNTLFGATIGQHIRHILEFYESALVGLKADIINYDNRKRDLLIETKIQYAIQIINKIDASLNQINFDKHIILEGNFCSEEGNSTQIESTLYRELAYCLEHSIHHQALIKVGLLELDCLSFIDDSFGLAPATIRHRKLCVQ
jgi:hypothetical protein